MLRTLITLFTLIGLFSVSTAQLSYTTDSIPMRDGKKLAADIYLNPDCSGNCPVILIQTPYNRVFYRFGLPMGIGTDITTSGYHFVILDWRGFYGSAAALNINADRGEDGYDAIDWINQQNWCDGSIGTWGPSALGKVQYQTANQQHPNHICAVPLVAQPVFAYDDFYYGGVLEESHLEQLDALGYGLSTTILAHQTKDLTWNIAESSTNYSSNIQIPVLMIGGWYDHSINSMLNYFSDLKQNSPAANEIKLLIGPWVHGGTGAAQVGTATQGELSFPQAAGWSDSLALDFFDFHLLGIQNGWDNFPDVKYFQINDNNWYDATEWPTSDVTNHSLFLQNDHTLRETTPTSTTGNSTIIFDPRDPSPTIGGATLHTTLDQGPYDQAPLVESRNDILTYTSLVLTDDIALKGRVIAHLFVSSDRTDTDFAVRLTDVHPNGTSMLITDGIKRMRFRDGYTNQDTSAITPGQVYEIEVELPPTSYTFLTGHQIRVDITSSHSRRWDINLNNGGAMYTSGDTLIATNIVEHNSIEPSYIELPLNDYQVSDNNIETPSFEIYPNPTTDVLYINSVTSPNTTASIYSATGKLITQTSLNQESNIITTSHLSPGVYFINLESQHHNLTYQLIKQ